MGQRLHPPESATTIRRRGGQLLITDGPFTESREWIAGFDILECADLDEAIAIAASHPMSAAGAVELRPFWPYEGRMTDGGAGDVVCRALADAMAEQRLRIVASLIRTTGDWDLAEDAVSDAAERALVTWPRDGVPDNPAAWLTATARRRAIDLLRRAQVERGQARRPGRARRADRRRAPSPRPWAMTACG